MPRLALLILTACLAPASSAQLPPGMALEWTADTPGAKRVAMTPDLVRAYVLGTGCGAGAELSQVNGLGTVFWTFDGPLLAHDRALLEVGPEGERVYAMVLDAVGHRVFALEEDDGDVLWSKEFDWSPDILANPSKRPTIPETGFGLAVSEDGARVVVSRWWADIALLDTDRYVITTAYDAATGGQLWEREYGVEVPSGVAGVEIVGDDVLIACGEDSGSILTVVSYDLESGFEQYAERYGCCGVAPEGLVASADGELFYVCTDDMKVWSFWVADGSVNWSSGDLFPLNVHTETAVDLVYSDALDALLVREEAREHASGDVVVALDGDDGGELWRANYGAQPSGWSATPAALSLDGEGTTCFFSAVFADEDAPSESLSVVEARDVAGGELLWQVAVPLPSCGFAYAASGNSPRELLIAGPDGLREYEVPELAVSTESVSLSNGGEQVWYLRPTTEYAELAYWVLGSATSGAVSVPVGHVEMALFPDAYFLWTLANANSGNLVDSQDFLGSTGKGEARIVVPSGLPASLAGATLHHAYLAFDELGGAIFASHSVPLTFE